VENFIKDFSRELNPLLERLNALLRVSSSMERTTKALPIIEEVKSVAHRYGHRAQLGISFDPPMLTVAFYPLPIEFDRLFLKEAGIAPNSFQTPA